MKRPGRFVFDYKLNSKIVNTTKYVVYMAFSVLVVLLAAHYVQKSFVYLDTKIHETPEKFRSQNTVSAQQYTADSLYLCRAIKLMNDEKIVKVKQPGITVIIDTIIYDSTYNKLAFWALCQSINPDTKVSSYLYTGNGFYAFRSTLNNHLQVSTYTEKAEIKPSYDEIRTLLEKKFFIETAHKGKKKQKPTYNWDDTRLWTSVVWDSIANHSSYTLSGTGLLVSNASLNSELAKQNAITAVKKQKAIVTAKTKFIPVPVRVKATVPVTAKPVQAPTSHKVTTPVAKPKTVQAAVKSKTLTAAPDKKPKQPANKQKQTTATAKKKLPETVKSKSTKTTKQKLTKPSGTKKIATKSAAKHKVTKPVKKQKAKQQPKKKKPVQSTKKKKKVSPAQQKKKTPVSKALPANQAKN